MHLPLYFQDKRGAHQYTWAAPASRGAVDAPPPPSATSPSHAHGNPCAPPASPQTSADKRATAHANPDTTHRPPPSPGPGDSPYGDAGGATPCAPCGGGDAARGGATPPPRSVGCASQIEPLYTTSSSMGRRERFGVAKGDDSGPGPESPEEGVERAHASGLFM